MSQTDETIPVIDLGAYRANHPGAREATAAELRVACEEIGFYFIANHGVSRSLVDRVFAETKRFHDQSLESKLAIKANMHNVGYMPYKTSVFRASSIYGGDKPDLNEALFLKRDLPSDHPDVLAGKRFRSQNRWPTDLPGFRETVVAYMDAMEALALELIPLYAVALDLPPGWFDEAFSHPMFTLRLTHYPPAEHAPDQYGIAPHSDSSFLTLLAQNETPGLSIQTRSGHWIDAPVLPDTFLVNSGNLLHRWSNERFLSTPHRAVNATDVDRYAIPFFFDCNIDYVMECLPTCQGPINPPKYPPTTYMDYMQWFTSQLYDHVREA